MPDFITEQSDNGSSNQPFLYLLEIWRPLGVASYQKLHSENDFITWRHSVAFSMSGSRSMKIGIKRLTSRVADMQKII